MLASPDKAAVAVTRSRLTTAGVNGGHFSLLFSQRGLFLLFWHDRYSPSFAQVSFSPYCGSKCGSHLQVPPVSDSMSA